MQGLLFPTYLLPLLYTLLLPLLYTAMYFYHAGHRLCHSVSFSGNLSQ